MSSYSDAVQALTGLVAYWRLGEPAGTVAIDQKYTHHGTYVESPTLGAVGAILAETDTAVTLNGSSQWATVAAATDLNLVNAFTIVAWAKRTGGANGAIFEKSVGGTVNTSFSLFFESGFVWGRAVKGAALTNVSSPDPADGAYHLWTLTYDGTNLRLYKDNGAASVSGAVAAPLDGGAGGSFIGVLPNLAFPFGGSLDEVAVYSRVLTSAEILNLYNVGTGVAPTTTASPTTARADIVAGFTAMMNAYIALHPTSVKRHFRIRPPSFDTDLPCSYLDLRPETIAYTSGTQTRTMTPSLVIVDRLTDNGETMDRFDVVVDALVEYIGGYGGPFGGHITQSSVWSNMTVADEGEQDGDSRFAAVRFGFPDLSIVEGRPRMKAAFVVALTATPEQIVNALHGVGLIVEVQAVIATAEQVVYACQARGMLAGLNPLTATPETIVLALIAAGIMEAS